MRRVLVLSLFSAFALTASAATGKAPADASVPASERPVSTGVTSPRLVHTAKISIAGNELPATYPMRSVVALKFNLDETGTPQNIEVVQPLTQTIDARVVEAVRQFRWTPAVLDNQAVPVVMNLNVEVQR